ncbi:thiosulfate sulfurtransferase GlpE [Sessilibacter sp. MAH2]
MTKYTEITVAEAKAIIANDNPLILDSRDAHSFKEGHIDGAMLAHDGLTEQLIKKKQFQQPVLIYCYHGNSSKDLAEFFGSIGFKTVYSMAGGYTAWKKLEEAA